MTSTATPPRLLTIAEVAERLRVSRQTVWRRVRDGSIPAVRLGDVPHSPLRIDERALMAWVYGLPDAGVSPFLRAREIPAHERAVPDQGQSTAAALAGSEVER